MPDEISFLFILKKKFLKKENVHSNIKASYQDSELEIPRDGYGEGDTQRVSHCNCCIDVQLFPHFLLLMSAWAVLFLPLWEKGEGN